MWILLIHIYTNLFILKLINILYFVLIDVYFVCYVKIKLSIEPVKLNCYLGKVLFYRQLEHGCKFSRVIIWAKR